MGGAGVEFCFERGELLGTELLAFGVGEQAVEAANDVAEVKRDGGQAGWAGVEGFVGEGRAPLVDVLAGEFESVDGGAENGWDIGVSAAEPRFHKSRV